ncbi:amidophosphoribosyltransferase [Saccharibacillus sp. O23]|uniref:ComF family protein n=1 Tax=Saccharibacillus sp. O23 TaxID=2009338 RepID=UPI000B4E044A|nr:ComF family protein [Saccharibacillus sp. O23]OWR26854.1 amidophosphoribosyltransferase [Saccharibacillus sp. O23]
MSGRISPSALLRRLLMPVSEACLSCGRPLASASQGELPLLCGRCADLVRWIERPRCPICGRAHGCPDCLRPEARHRAFVLNRSAAVYDTAMRRWIAEYKYGGRESFADPFSVMLERTYRRMRRELSVQEKDRARGLFYRKRNGWNADLVTWVPVSEQRLEERGFNQAELAAKRMALRLRLPAAELLTRNVHTEKQSFKSRAERLHNLDGVFSLIPNLDPGDFKKWDLVGNSKRPGGPFPIRVLLVDDIYTTGTTAAVCASALQSLENVFARPVLVYVLTLARS